MKQKLISLSDAEMEYLKRQAEALELTVNEVIRRIIDNAMVTQAPAASTAEVGRHGRDAEQETCGDQG